MLKVPAREKLEEFDKVEGTESCPFRELVGLMGLAISTRPDMSNAVRSVVRDWSRRKPFTVKRRLVFSHTHINGTSGFSITNQRGISVGMYFEVFANAGYASKANDRIMRIVSGGAIMGGGACVCWFSRTQKCVTLFTSEAECIAFGDAVNELFFLRQVLRFMIPGKNLVSNSNSKQIDVRHLFL